MRGGASWSTAGTLRARTVPRGARAGAARQRLLDRTAATDAALADEVRSLLAVHTASDQRFLEEPAWAVAPTLAFEAEPAMAAGTDIGPYRIVKEIGRGGMGVVYEAEDTRLRRTVALKALPAEYARDPVRRERLTREARAAASLTHPSIATIYALEEQDGSLYLVSELVRGQTLRDELARGPLPPERLLPTLIELASGLAAAHAAGIVHRDFKPENIVRCLDGRVKILDFGLARLAAERDEADADGHGPRHARLHAAGTTRGAGRRCADRRVRVRRRRVGTGHRRPSARGKRRRAAWAAWRTCWTGRRCRPLARFRSPASSPSCGAPCGGMPPSAIDRPSSSCRSSSRCD